MANGDEKLLPTALLIWEKERGKSKKVNMVQATENLSRRKRSPHLHDSKTLSTKIYDNGQIQIATHDYLLQPNLHSTVFEKAFFPRPVVSMYVCLLIVSCYAFKLFESSHLVEDTYIPCPPHCVWPVTRETEHSLPSCSTHYGNCVIRHAKSPTPPNLLMDLEQRNTLTTKMPTRTRSISNWVQIETLNWVQ